MTFREFRRDPEDGGRWFMLGDFSQSSFADEQSLLDEARAKTGWIAA